MSNSIQNKPEGYPYEDADFYPKYQEVCPICGITSFAHRHKAGSKPKDFERIPEDRKTKERALGESLNKTTMDYLRKNKPIYSQEDVERIVSVERKDARKEVIRKIEGLTRTGSSINGCSCETCREEAGDEHYNKAISDVLSTLREEEGL